MRKNWPYFLLVFLSIPIFCGFLWLAYSFNHWDLNDSTYSGEPQQKDDNAFSYLALGDSYTICESVKEHERWPNQLKKKLLDTNLAIQNPVIIAKTGWRTDNMLDAATKEVKKKKFDLVSLLIGVNNEYQQRTPESFKPEFRKCLNYAIDHCNGGKEGVFVVSIPDYGYTPFGAKNQKKISPRLDEYNKICKDISKEMGVKFFDITPISRQDPHDKSLVAEDGLHPSGKQYGLWVDSFLDDVYKMLRK